jgi:peptide deformylase
MKKRRFESVIVHALDLNRELFQLPVTGLAAIAVQHESDHLDGVLMVDGTLSRHARRKLTARLRKR